MTDVLSNDKATSPITEDAYSHFLVDLTDNILSAKNLPNLLRNTADKLNDFFNLDFVAIEVPHLPSCNLRAYYATYEGHRLDRYDCDIQPLQQSFLQEVMENHEKLLLDRTKLVSYKKELQHLKNTPIEKLLSLMDFPLLSGDEVIGILAVGSFTQDSFSGETINVLEKVARRIAFALETILTKESATGIAPYFPSGRTITIDTHIPSSSGLYDVIGQSKAIKDILQQIKIVADSNATVLILGETGTGKGLIAQTIHNLSRRKNHQMIRLNCTAIPSDLMENELFGHEKGAFTGAQSRTIGHCEQANHSTLFLDEIGDMPIELQPKLLSVLQDKQIRRLGGSETIPVDVRFIAATNNDLLAKVHDKTFRSDLYYRLNVFPITVPPLRERVADIPLLTKFFTLKFAKKFGRVITEIPADTLAMMTRMPWHGNIRELENVIERAVILTNEGHVLNLTPDFLRHLESQHQSEIIQPTQKASIPSTIPESGTGKALPETDRETLVSALKACQGVIGGRQGAAARLGLKRTTLLARLKKLGIDPDEFRNPTT
ncbi:MAG: sigma 54-interacting transcriptional regulator [Oxalobacter sp.]|nr:sigma 54-interacting transcriptional regulator [Oxalobacter sp.]